MWNIALATGNIFLSLILGAIAFVICGLNYPHVVDSMQKVAAHIKDAITSFGIPVEYNIWVSFIVDEQQFVLMFFVILVRILLAVIGTLFSSLFSTN